jgi:MFS family permease
MSRRRSLLVTIGVGAPALALWFLASEPWGLAAYQLIVFAAPGALLGLGASWMAYSSRQSDWSWRIARNWTLIGAALLPPILAFLIALDGNARPHGLLAGFIRAAWLALALGLAVAAGRAARDKSQERRKQIRARLQHPLPPRASAELGQRDLVGMRQIVGERRFHRLRKRSVVNDQG